MLERKTLLLLQHPVELQTYILNMGIGSPSKRLDEIKYSLDTPTTYNLLISLQTNKRVIEFGLCELHACMWMKYTH